MILEKIVKLAVYYDLGIYLTLINLNIANYFEYELGDMEVNAMMILLR